MQKNNFTFKTSQGKEVEVIFRKPQKNFYGKNCDGYCIDPDVKSPKIYINPHRTDQTQLNTILHEFAHAFFWDAPEHKVKKFGDTLSRFLYNEQKWRKEE
jgi:Zn-dependent peptidase ImmA (M78 family)